MYKTTIIKLVLWEYLQLKFVKLLCCVFLFSFLLCRVAAENTMPSTEAKRCSGHVEAARGSIWNRELALLPISFPFPSASDRSKEKETKVSKWRPPSRPSAKPSPPSATTSTPPPNPSPTPSKGDRFPSVTNSSHFSLGFASKKPYSDRYSSSRFGGLRFLAVPRPPDLLRRRRPRTPRVHGLRDRLLRGAPRPLQRGLQEPSEVHRGSRRSDAELRLRPRWGTPPGETLISLLSWFV